MKKRIYSFWIIVGVMISCENMDWMMPSNDVAAETMTVSEERAICELRDMLGDMYGETRSMDFGEFVLSPVYRNAVTRSSIDAAIPMAYIVNFENGGYAVLGADYRQPPVFAVSDNGRLSAEMLDSAKRSVEAGEEVDTPTYINAVLAYRIENSIEETPIRRIEIPPTTDWKIVEEQKPLMITKWTQKGGAYNKYCPWMEDIQRFAAAGCTAIATAQVMAYNHKTFGIGPQRIGIQPINWDLIDEAARHSSANDLSEEIQDQVGLFIRAIGDVIKMKYGYTSSAPIENVAEYWSRNTNGTYKNVYVVDLPENKPENKLEMLAFTKQYIRPMVYEQKLPVVITALDLNPEVWSGHSWVIDGWMRRERSTSTGMQAQEYVYCNFGWDGLSDCDDAGVPILYEFGFFQPFGRDENYSTFPGIINYKLCN